MNQLKKEPSNTTTKITTLKDKTMILQSMTDFIESRYNNAMSNGKDSAYQVLTSILSYKDFLKQPLKLGMFIPCNDNDVPLEEPKEKPTLQSDGTVFDDYDVIEMEQYQQAKERVLFEGFELLRDVGYAWIFKYYVQGSTLFYKKIEFGVKKSYKIEDLIIDFPEALKLTDSAIKQIKKD